MIAVRFRKDLLNDILKLGFKHEHYGSSYISITNQNRVYTQQTRKGLTLVSEKTFKNFILHRYLKMKKEIHLEFLL